MTHDMGIRVLEAREGFKLTQKSVKNERDRIVTGHIELAVNDSPENWTEITDEEARAILSAQDETAGTAG